ncbi:MAG: DUF1552 domain-containing protein [Myxococcales bacterium]|nr:MAG: DUF1552 domain-containing protein [Myxococcales bacterium]
MKKRLNRRVFLRGLGGACVAAPFLGSLAERQAKADGALPAAPPKRLILMFTHYGCITTRFFPAKSHGPLSAEDLLPTTLKHLAPFADKLLLPRGIRAMNEWTAAMVRGQGNDPHTQVVGSYFTCQPVTPNSNDPFSFGDSKFRAMPVGPSLDHVIAQQLSLTAESMVMNVGGFKEQQQSAVSYSASERLFPGHATAREALAAITGLFTGAPLTPDSYAVARGKSILDVVQDDLATLARKDMSEADRRKLGDWKELLHQTGQGVSYEQCTTQLAPSLGLTEATLEAATRADPAWDRLTMPISGTGLESADLWSSIATLAALCQANPVILLKYPPNIVLRGLGIDVDTAALSNRQEGAGMVGPCAPGAIEKLLKIDDFYARKFAFLVQQLGRFDEGEGTVLDNSAAIWFQEMSDGAAHNLNNLPIVQVGSAGGYFKTGCAVNVWDGTADLSRGNSESACTPTTSQEIDGLSQSTGTDPAIANTPINKYYCALMNALGVKAGEDGFPLVGGSGEVTRFGKYDRTEDFIGGDVNPAMIHDPGELTALRRS